MLAALASVATEEIKDMRRVEATVGVTAMASKRVTEQPETFSVLLQARKGRIGLTGLGHLFRPEFRKLTRFTSRNLF